MKPTEVTSLGKELETTLRLLNDLVLELQAMDAKLGSMGRVQELVDALGRQPNLAQLPAVMLRVYSEIAEALHGIRLSRETIQTYSIDRLRDTHARLTEVSSTTESAAMEMLNGLDRSLAMVDQLEASVGGSDRPSPEVFNALRNEVNQLYGLLQFQDIISQQLQGVAAMLVEVEQRMETVASLFDGTRELARAARNGLPTPDPHAYNAEATMRDAVTRQAAIDQTVRAARDAAPAA